MNLSVLNPTIPESKKLNRLFQGKFKALEGYFWMLDSTDDIKLLTENDFLNLAKGDNKLLMKLFIKKVLKPYFRDIKKSSLTLKDRVISSKYKIVRFNKISMEHVPDQSWGFLEDDDCENNIYLSYNHLSDCDTKYIRQLIESAPNLNIVDLSNNDFEGKEEFEKTLLFILERVKWLDITYNPFSQKSSFFQSISEDILQKLIFIPEVILSDNSWEKLLGNNEEKCELVKKRHKEYYLIN
jgi:hypothetical protein